MNRSKIVSVLVGALLMLCVQTVTAQADYITGYVLDGLLGRKSEGQQELIEAYWHEGNADSVFEGSFSVGDAAGQARVKLSLLETDEYYAWLKVRMNVSAGGKKSSFRFNAGGMVGVSVADADFDGYTDILVAKDGGGSGGRTYDLYRYDPAKKQFVETDVHLLNADFYPEKKLIVYKEWMGQGYISYDIHTWQGGKLVSVARVSAEESGYDPGSDSCKACLVSYTGQDGKTESKEIPAAFESLSNSERKPYLRFLDGIRKRLRSALR